MEQPQIAEDMRMTCSQGRLLEMGEQTHLGLMAGRDTPLKAEVDDYEMVSLENGRESPSSLKNSPEEGRHDHHAGVGADSGRDSPLKPDSEGMVLEGEDVLAKLREQVSSAKLLTQGISNNNHINSLYDRLHTLLQGKMAKGEDGEGGEDSRDLVLRAEALQRQRESLLSSPQALMNAMRGGGPPSLVPPGPHLPFIPSTVGLPPTSQMPPTPGSAGSRDSSGNGTRTPSHTPEPHQSQQSWSFEEQFKQLYELSDDPKRKEFLDELFSLMQKRGTPINRLPIMAKQVLDLYELYNLVVARGGLVDVINKKLWQEIIKGLKLPSSITSAAFTLRTQYVKYLYPYECEKEHLSTPADLQSAVDGNKREGRRPPYGTYCEGLSPPLLPLQNLQSLQNLHNLQNHMNLSTHRHFNGNGALHPSPLAQDYLMGRGGSPPGSQEALLEATRLTMWKLYNQGLGGGFQHEEDGPKLPPPPHPLAGIPFPPQKEALNLDVKEDECHEGRVYPGLCPQRPPRQEKTAELRPPMGVGLGGMLTPTAKRPMHHEEPLETRPPMPASPTHHQPLTPSLPSIKISSRGNGRSQDQSIVVSMEINGILYQGVLFPQAPRTRLS
ncbi:AT-rich interactive domain-containing protein 3C isoform X2 [Penaeus vannamei]|uniref:AT-rich interactive domain-containing protein 3C isoform X2 n=1 Tax=Penaeus vannamei TaxID=6689 RepID=UPI00387FA323